VLIALLLAACGGGNGSDVSIPDPFRAYDSGYEAGEELLPAVLEEGTMTGNEAIEACTESATEMGYTTQLEIDEFGDGCDDAIKDGVDAAFDIFP
jgi:hypothetical protein